jgi:hypothetical protein
VDLAVVAKARVILLRWVGVVAVVVLAVLIGLGLWLIDRQIPAPTLVDPASPVATSTQLAYYLGRWGLVLMIIGFVPLVVAEVIRAYRTPSIMGEAETAPWDKLFDIIPVLIKSPIGVGMALILTAATLLVAVAAAKDNAAAPSPSPSSAPAATPNTKPGG